MKIVKKEEFNRKLPVPLRHEFEAENEGLYILEVRARAKSEKQIDPNGTDDDDLKIEIDGRRFSSKAAFSGGQLHNLTKIVYFILCFSKGRHSIELIPDKAPFLKSFSIGFLGITVSEISFEVNEVAEDGDRRPWISYVLVNMPLKSLTVEATAKWRFRDSDDLKLIIDGTVQKNEDFFSRRDWLWSGSILRKFFLCETQTKKIQTHLLSGVHYIEFLADREPSIQSVNFDFGLPVKRIPDMYDPEWTGFFIEDSDEILLARLILGEAEDQPHEAKIWVGASILNRVKASAWPDTIHGVILQAGQYDPFKQKDVTYSKIIDPLKDQTSTQKKVWKDCYEIAQGLISGAIKNETTATHFHGRGITEEWFMSHIVPKGKFLKRIGDSYFYWSPN